MRGTPPPTSLAGGFVGGTLNLFAQAPATSGTWREHLLGLGQT